MFERFSDKIDSNSIVNREPIWRKAENAVSGSLSEVRNEPGSRIKDKAPEMRTRNAGRGQLVGVAGAGIATILEDTVGVPFGASVDVVGVEPTSDGVGTIYTVNVNAPTQNMAEARAFIDSSTGFVSYLTDKYEIEDAEVLKQRFGRDTYQVVVRVED